MTPRHVLIPALVVAGVALPAACSFKRKSGGEAIDEKKASGHRFTEDEVKADSDVVGYAKYCKQELEIPPETLAPFNCMEGIEIPVTIDGKPLDEKNYKEMIERKTGCDLPSWLGEEPCSNYAFVQQREIAPNVQASLLCRMRAFSTHKDRATRRAEYEANPTFQNFMAYYVFDSLGLIWTNTKSGKTCYFDFVGKTYGGYVPSPDDERLPEFADLPDPKPPTEIGPGTEREFLWKRNARATWKPPTEVGAKDNCIRCHDTGPYKSSPWIRQVVDVPHNSGGTPYIIVGSALASWKERFPVRAISTAPIENNGKLEPQICTTCHRIGSEATCDAQIDYATGAREPAKLSPTGSRFKTKAWMPPPPPEWHHMNDETFQKVWTDSFDKHVARLKCCCNNPSAKNCTSQDFTTDPISPPVIGQGPEICP
jgi:hypothetical protein